MSEENVFCYSPVRAATPAHRSAVAGVVIIVVVAAVAAVAAVATVVVTTVVAVVVVAVPTLLLMGVLLVAAATAAKTSEQSCHGDRTMLMRVEWRKVSSTSAQRLQPFEALATQLRF